MMVNDYDGVEEVLDYVGIEITPDPNAMFSREYIEGLKERVVDDYRQGRKNASSPSCVAVINSEIGGSSLDRALYELYREVRKHDGQLVCVKYPDAYIGSLNALGLPSLPGFSLAYSEKEARQRIGLT